MRVDVVRAPAAEPDASAIEADVVALHNAERSRRGLPPLTIDPRLAAAAQRHARDMAARHRMSHRGSDGSSPFRRMEAEGFAFRRAGENVAAGDLTAESAMGLWMKSPPHRRNVLGNFSRIGAGYATAEDGRSYWCVTFGSVAEADSLAAGRSSAILQ
jgi:uncharacterized protein YkwD